MSTEGALKNAGKPVTGPFEKTKGWLDWYEGPSAQAFRFRAAPSTRIAMCLDPAPSSLMRLSANTPPATPARRNCSLFGTVSASIATSSCRRLVMAPTIARWSTRFSQARAGRAESRPCRRDVTDAELKRLHEAGVRGVRFNFIKRLVDFTPMDELKAITERIIERDWHIVVYFESADLPELEDFFSELPTTIVVDHMGRPDVTKPVEGPEFARFLKFMDDYENVWCKVSCPERLSVSGPPALNGEKNAYRDVVPFARKVVEEFPDRVLWGTDWPHPNLKDHMPDDGLMVDIIPHIAPAADLQDLLLVDNPTRLYWAEERTR